MPSLPPEAVTAAAAAIDREMPPGEVFTMTATSGETIARWALEAAAPVLADAVAQRILAHMEAREPRGDLIGGTAAEAQRRRTWRRHFGIAARVAAWAFTTEDERKRMAAEALARGDFIACGIPEPSISSENEGES